jgi:hypothetical protein
MDLLTLYVVCSLVVAIAADQVILKPIFKMAKEANIDNGVTQYPTITRLSFFCISLLVSPLIFLVLTNKAMIESFITGAYIGMTKD